MRVGLTLAIVAVAVLAFTRTIAVALAVPDQAIISQVHKVLERVFISHISKYFVEKTTTHHCKKNKNTNRQTVKPIIPSVAMAVPTVEVARLTLAVVALAQD